MTTNESFVNILAYFKGPFLQWTFMNSPFSGFKILCYKCTKLPISESTCLFMTYISTGSLESSTIFKSIVIH